MNIWPVSMRMGHRLMNVFVLMRHRAHGEIMGMLMMTIVVSMSVRVLQALVIVNSSGKALP
jgi:hypothetical protein